MSRTTWTAASVVGLWGILAIGLIAWTPGSPWPWLQMPQSRLAPPDPDEPPPLAEGPEREHREQPIGDLASIFPNLVILRGSGEIRQVALTFDDGPDPRFSPHILDILRDRGVRATFFVVGSRVDESPELLRRMVREGHAIGNHSYFHSRYSAMNRAEIALDLARCDDAIHRAVGQRPRLFRPPYGALDADSVRSIAGQGYRIILWSVDSRDWQSPGRAAVISNALGPVHPGAIILFHCGGGPGQDLSGTVQALPDIIDRLRAQGYRMVTIPEMLETLAGNTGPAITGALPPG